MSDKNSIEAQSKEYELKRSVKNNMGLAVFAVVMTMVVLVAGICILVDR